jgi:hypothetical protein
VIEAYAAVNSAIPLLIVGDAPYAEYIAAEIHRTTESASPTESWYRLTASCSRMPCLYSRDEVGGTQSTLVEAMEW